jgi:predicted 2-oxoglutarate/Fe(II)-dependent dioxygenase YbiX
MAGACPGDSGTLGDPRTRGALIVFPWFFLHRVTPIVSGNRKALVAWATGPDFR